MEKLKYIFRVLLIVCVVVLVSCKDDENDNNLQTIIANVPIGTPYIIGEADMYIVGDMNDWKIVEEFKMSSFGYNVDTAATNAAGDKWMNIIAGRKYQITLTNLPQGTKYKYVMVVNETAYPEVDANVNTVPDYVLGNFRATSDTVKYWKGITIDGQLPHKFSLTALKGVEGDVYLVFKDQDSDTYTELVNKMNKDDDGKYSITLENVPDKVEYRYVLVVDGEPHIEMGASPPPSVSDCAPEIENSKDTPRVTAKYDIRVSNTVLNWKGVTTCLTTPEEPEEPEVE